ncbi:hypothetical protein Kpol_1053p20 [Vanderwaltozyma polyspora DSM 70294]|uniref:ADF-H domain-containing protein n=1 Tax=Vanderwaltozyma polyspora (strain ATCC 22028 / DSM 70294 / BCRC 21397 / CBS 2163 / NBRC 10782 / NRRL Y-8283 / UCD 57-17) TaxID=436907 RepID=A7TN65_VANPO|nr:uncharacterized protein Kpol_1053p20 [Vanderwaltozyma polyspora DSM 70294]EDO16283.1 hypothetical protein Kpol_1053p20 [Vanderwaltozyma polyspora DSM 70294]
MFAIYTGAFAIASIYRGIKKRNKDKKLTKMSSLNHISTGTRDKIRKFRTSTSRTEVIRGLSIKILPNPSYEIVVDEEETDELDDIKDLSEYADVLPDNSPRYVLIAYPLTDKDGIKKAPLILLYWKPNTVVSQEWKMLYASALEMIRNECGPSKLIEVSSGLEDESDVEDLIKEILK